MRALLSLLFLLALPAAAWSAEERWAVYYGDKLPAEQFVGFDVIVFDREHHPPLETLQAKTLLGYISLGEAESYRGDFDEVKQKGFLLGRNEQWKDHAVIDLRKPEWKAYVLDVLIPATLAEGFGGVMLDTIDSPLQLETDQPEKYKGMREAAADLIRSIRARYPDIKIMLNRGFDILPQVAGNIDMVMAETIYTDWQPGKKNPVLQPQEEYAAYVTTLKEAQRVSPTLKVYSLDYWPSKDEKQVRAIYARQRSEGFIPYVAPTLSLESLGSRPL